jgi:hypothetical protein
MSTSKPKIWIRYTYTSNYKTCQCYSPEMTQHATLSVMQSPMLMKSASLPRPCQLGEVHGVYLQPSIIVLTIAQYSVTSCASTPSSIDTIQASANFPPDDTTCLVHTHASYSKQPIPELVNNDYGNWTLTLNVPIPDDLVHPTLTSFSYTIKYSTANHNRASVVQSHILLAVAGSKAIREEISVNTNGHYHDGVTVTPKTFGGAATMGLSSAQGVKESDPQGQRQHLKRDQTAIEPTPKFPSWGR